MKTIRMSSVNGLVLLLVVIFIGANQVCRAQTNHVRRVPAEYGTVPIFTNNPTAMHVITNLLQGPQPELSVPVMSQTNSAPGTYWTLKGVPVPLPYNPFPELNVYQISSNNAFIIDDRSVDYPTLNALNAAEAEAMASTNPPVFTGCQTCEWNDHGRLWIEVPTNSLATPDYFTVAIQNSIQGQSYDVLTTADLLASFATEMVVTGAVGTVTSLQIPTNGRTNLFVRARTSVGFSFYLMALPMSQDVLAGDTVTFFVETGGNPNLTFQWILNGNTIPDATNSSYTIYNVQPGDAGDYACIISDGTSYLTTAAGTLTVENGTGDLNLMAVVSARQNYTFKSGVTYYIGSQIQFYGNTTIEAGTVIKPDWYYTAGLVIMGNLICKGEPYCPAVITSVDDDSIGENLGFSQDDGPPQPHQTGVPYLELACCKTDSISNLRIAYADYGVTTPTELRRLDVWDCQFLKCNYGVVNLVAGDSTNTLHNVLFAACSAAFGAATNAITIEAEQVTADVTDFCRAYATPARMDLKNSIIWGSAPDATSLSSLYVALNPDGTNFVTSGAGLYYLAANSSLHHSGWTAISSRLQTELKSKTTFAPVVIAPFTQISGQITLAPQAQRYTNGAPDLGYHYDALDYTVAGLILKGGTLNVLPGTAIGFRMESYPNGFPSPLGFNLYWSYVGLDVRENSALISQGLPGKPNVFVDVQQVQEQFQWPVWAGVVPDYFPTDLSDQPPTLDFRFSKFFLNYVSYMNEPALHFWSGIDLVTGNEWSISSAMNFRLQDSQIRGGQISLGTPDNPDYGYGFLNYDTVLGSGAIAWNNNLFDGVSINLNPTYYWYNQITNCDLQVTAYNNLFRNSPWLNIFGIPATVGNWTFRDNLFDKVQFYQDPSLPLDFDHNGYWPLGGAEMLNGYTNRLQATATSSGATEVFLNAVPPYQGGVFGDYYLAQTTSLYQAGSRTATNAGLAQYTTFINQTKDAANQPVNIGLHYVAATNSLPQDSDGDGVPDYVEVEHGTDLNNAMTDGVTPDAYSTVYDSIDLDGDGLNGDAERFFGVNPLNEDNPLKLPAAVLSEPLSGVVQIPLNLSSQVDSNTPFLFTINGTTDNTRVYQTNGQWFAEWNTPMKANGSYQLQLEYELAEENTAVGGGNFVTVHNDVCFPNNYPVAGDSLHIRPQTIYTNGTWTMDIYDDQTNLFTTLEGAVDANGYFLDPNTAQPGISISLLDTNNNQLPSAYYSVEVTAAAQANAAGATSGRRKIKVYAERPRWSGNGQWVIANMPLYGPDPFANDAAHQLADTMAASITMVQENTSYGYNSINNSPITASGNLPLILGEPRDWTTLRTLLQTGNNRNFYFFGHGGADLIGSLQGTSLKESDLKALLNNAPDPLYGVNQHPYRFVFLNGCNTGKGDLATIFGIPKETIPLDDWNNKYNLPPRAFIGWNGYKWTSAANKFNGELKVYLDAFWQIWSSHQFSLQDAINQAALNSQGEPMTSLNKKIILYGCPQLPF